MLHASAYETNPFNGNDWRNIALTDNKDFDSSWNFVYYGFSREQAKAFFYHYGGYSGGVVS